jgi:hypothetical protein
MTNISRILVIFLLCNFIALSDPIDKLNREMKVDIGFDDSTEAILISCIYGKQRSVFLINKKDEEIKFINYVGDVKIKGVIENSLIGVNIIDIINKDRLFFKDFSLSDRSILDDGNDGLSLMVSYKKQTVNVWSPVYMYVMGLVDDDLKLDKDLLSYVKLVVQLNLLFPKTSDLYYLNDLDILKLSESDDLLRKKLLNYAEFQKQKENQKE